MAAKRLAALLRKVAQLLRRAPSQPAVPQQSEGILQMGEGARLLGIPQTQEEFLENLGYWEAQYFNDPRVGTDYDVPYFENIRTGCGLVASNIEPLWRWKKVRPAKLRTIVACTIAILPEINLFRVRSIGEEEAFWKACTTVSKVGTVYQVFLFHMARPHEYPIFDQHVRRAFRYLKGGGGAAGFVPPSLSYEKFVENYKEYMDFFFELLPKCCGNARVLDRALWKLGKHLKDMSS